MNFPGENTLKLSHETMKSIIIEALQRQYGDAIRITSLEYRGYTNPHVELTFTTDAKPADEVTE